MKKIKQESENQNVVSDLDKINEGIRMLNHITCTIERVNRIQKGVECSSDEDYNFSQPLKSVGQLGTRPANMSH